MGQPSQGASDSASRTPGFGGVGSFSSGFAQEVAPAAGATERFARCASTSTHRHAPAREALATAPITADGREDVAPRARAEGADAPESRRAPGAFLHTSNGLLAYDGAATSQRPSDTRRSSILTGVSTPTTKPARAVTSYVIARVKNVDDRPRGR